MTAQQQQKKVTKWLNVNTVITSICTAVLMYVGAGMNKVYKQLSNQPGVDEKQTSAIVNLISDVKETKAETKKNTESIIKLEAILPDPNQFKVK